MSDIMPERIASAQFIRELWGISPSDSIVEFNLLQYRPTQENPDDKRMRAIFYTVKQVLDDWETISSQLWNFNKKVENIHHGVNPRFQRPRKHGTNADVSHYVAVWVDVDFHGHEESVRGQFSEIIADLRARRLGPSVIVESGRGLHAYWLFDKPYPTAQARPICAGIQDYFKISDAVHDPRRILRVPGFANLKDPKNPCWCKVSEATWERFRIDQLKEFSISDFRKSEEDLEIEADRKELEKAATGSSRDPKIEEVKRGVDESGGPYGGRHLSAVALAGHYCARLKTKKNVLYAMRDWNLRNKPPLPDDEIEKVVEDIWIKEEIKRAEEKDERKERRKDDEIHRPSDGVPWFDEDGRLVPALLAAHIMSETKFLATPIGDDGKGVRLYFYKDGAFRPGGSDFARREVVKAMGKSLRDKHLTEVVELVTEISKRPYDEVDRHSRDLINVANGMLNWRSGELLAHDPKYLSTIQIPVPWNPDAKSEKLEAFFKTVLPEDAVSLVEEYAGYMMIPDTSMTKCLVLVGEGGNGKSTFLELLEHLIGERNISYYSLHNLTEERFAAAGLVGKLANFYDELEAKALENTGVFKQIVGGNPIKAEEKGKAPFSFRPFCRMIFATNQMPRATDRSQAYFDRFLFVEFNRRIRDTGGEVKHYSAALAAEPGLLQALLVHAVGGLRRLLDRSRFTIPGSSRDALEEYRRDCNSAYDFLRDCCREEVNGWLAGPVFYDRYKVWSEETGRKPMSTREFNKTIRGANVREVRRGEARGWGGLTWSNGGPPTGAKDEVAGFGTTTTTPSPPTQRQAGLDF